MNRETVGTQDTHLTLLGETIGLYTVTTFVPFESRKTTNGGIVYNVCTVHMIFYRYKNFFKNFPLKIICDKTHNDFFLFSL